MEILRKERSMKIRIPLLTQDIQTAEKFKIKAVEGFDPDREDFFLDGPVTKRVAVLDFDPGSGQLTACALFVPPPENGNEASTGTKRGRTCTTPPRGMVQPGLYVGERVCHHPAHDLPVRGEGDSGARADLGFRRAAIAGHPRAGKMSNAFYQRDSHSLQFFYNQARTAPGRTIYTCLSRDIVAHETGHAIIDGIVPDLADNSSPQSLALHEGLADLTALLLAFSSTPCGGT